MTASALILPDRERHHEFGRWSLAAAIALAAHFGVVATYLLMPKPGPQGAPVAPAVIIDLAPEPVAPASPLDLAPGPQTPEVQETPPEPVPEPVIEPPPEPLPKVEPLPEPPPPPPKVEAEPEVVLPLPAPKPKPEEKPVVKEPEPQKRVRHRPASHATAAPRSDRRTADRPAAPSPGSQASRAAMASWRSQVSSRLQSVKRCPSGGGGTGSSYISFTVDRGGRVVRKGIVRSSGNSALDQEALAMVSRAAPFPTVPAAMSAPVRLPVPINFKCR
jgi:protein TonB